MVKRDSEDIQSLDSKKPKLEDKKDQELAIDSELLGQQSSYQNKDSEQEQDSTVAAAVAAVTSAVSSDQISHHQHQQQQHHHQQQQQQHQHQQQQHQHQQAQQQNQSSNHLHNMNYQNAYRQQQQVQQQAQQHLHSHQQQLQQQQAQSSAFQPTTLPPSNSNKPQHGSDEWHRQRRENHKEVERRRRESINVGIKELASLIPTEDTNKAQILQRAVEYIKRLKENENNNIEKWTLEKLLSDQVVSDYSASNEKLKQELERAYREIEQWKKLAKENGKA